MLKGRAEELQAKLSETAQQLFEGIIIQAESLKQQATAFEVDFKQKLSELALENDRIEIEGESKNNTTTNSEVVSEAVAQIQPADPPDASKTEEESVVSTADSNAMENEECVELEILPPRDKDEIARIKAYLDSLAEVRTTELITLSDKTSVKVSLSKPMNLIEMLRALPQVKEAKEVMEEEQRKIKIALSMRSQLEYTKDTLRAETYRIFSGGR